MRSSRQSIRARPKLKGIRRVRQDGKVYRYHRASGTRLPDDLAEDHPDFLAAYLAAEKAFQEGTVKNKSTYKPKPGTLAHSWWLFCKSDDFLDLSIGYRRRMQAHGEVICQTGGKVPLNQIRAYHIENDISELDRNAARTRLKTWRKFLGWAHPRLIEKNWAMHVDMPKVKKGQRHKRWTDNHIQMFRNHWPLETPQRLAMELLLFTGMRLCDAVRSGPRWVDQEGWLEFEQKKTGGKVLIAFDRGHPDFADTEAYQFLKQSIALKQKKHSTWLSTRSGRQRSEKAASNWFSDACRKAGLLNEDRRTAHGLRDTCCARVAERGATSHQLMTWSGHESLDEAERYTKEASKKELLSIGRNAPKLFRSSISEQTEV